MILENIAIQTIGHIAQAAGDAIEVRRARGVEYVWLIFNDLPIRVTASSTPESVCETYDAKRRDHHYGEHCALR